MTPPITRPRGPQRRVCLAVILTAAWLGAAGCHNIDFDRVRAEHARQYPAKLAARTAEQLPADQPTGLDDCIHIALANNLEIKTAEINSRLATLDRRIAFSRFLPNIEVGVTHTSDNHQQAIGFGDEYTPMADRAITVSVLSAQMDVFAPETWFLYDAHVKGEAVSELVRRRTRDLIRLEVTTLYFACLSQREARDALLASCERADALLQQTQALNREDLATHSQVEQSRTLAKACRVSLTRNDLVLRDTKAALLEAMGLDPTTEITLAIETPLVVQDKDIADQILDALIQRPEMYIADRTIEIRKDETRAAIARFIPKLLGFSDLTNNTNSFLKFENIWTLGASAVLTVFDGFANIHEYQAARTREEQAAIDRERACLAIMLEVVRARASYEQAKDQYDLARQELAVADLLLDESQARYREGLIDTTARLDATARHAAARANAATAGFQAQVAAATLLDVLGNTPEGNDRE